VSRRLAGLALVALAGLAVAGCLPTPATAEARQVADLYTTFMVLAAIVAAIVLGLTFFAVLRYRRRRGDDDTLPRQVHGNLAFEITWTGLPIVTIVGLLVLTVLVLNSFDAAVQATAGAEIRVTAYRWGWRFDYPQDGVRVEGLGQPGPEVYVPVGEPVRVTLTGEDVNHAFFVPEFLFKKDAIPGRENVFAFTVDEPGRYGGQCAEFCGIYHARMPFTVVAVSRAEYDAWLAQAAGAGPILVTPLPSAPPAESPTLPAPEASGPFEASPTILPSRSP
jgi:cytochrome c oxidase subunit 2